MILDAMASGQNVNLAALDPVYVKCCLETFELIRGLIKDITIDRPERRKRLLDLSERCETFARSIYTHHTDHWEATEPTTLDGTHQR